ncbi:hypothetical protein BH18ACT4_BH18ACT4_07420 [soil metagenome]
MAAAVEPALAERRHLSIGEVLSLLQEEFPDVTISKIRFLESQGLLDPERTPSGYRKFYEIDVDRLRWILRQQRENFLPLKIIKDRLEESARTGRPQSDLNGDVAMTGYAGGERDQSGPAGPSPAQLDHTGVDNPVGPVPASAPSPAPSNPVTAPVAAPATTGSPMAPGRPPPTGGHRPPPPLVSEPSATTLTMTADEVTAATGLTDHDLADLERYGLLRGRIVGRDTLYEEDALSVARLAAGFLRFGVEARHLRMYKVAAEREAGFFEQVVMPMLKQRNPASRQRALDALSELAGLGDGLRAAMLRQALRSYTTER